MRRTILILFLCVAMIGGGAYLLVRGPTIRYPQLYDIPLNRFVAIALFASAGAAALLRLLLLTVSCRRLSSRLKVIDDLAQVENLQMPGADFRDLLSGLRSVADCGRRAIDDARIRAKEFEIQLKVATAERQHAEAIIYSISDAVLVTDTFDEVVLANDSAAKTFNFELSRAARAPLAKILQDDKMVGLITDMRQSDTRCGRRIVEHHIATPSGQRTYKVTLSSVASRDDRPAGVVAVLHDMTREQEVAQMKNDFVSSVSHELRTPLASIKAYAEMLIDGEAGDDKTRGEFYEVIQNEANRLGRLIDNILNISRIESGLVKMNKQPQSLVVILKEAVEVIAPQARQKQITVEEHISPAYYHALIDRDMIYEAILNLLSNAVKYTPEGGKIVVQTDVDESKKKVTARICDSGVGIPQKDLPFVFDKFYRCESNSRMAKGTGLGLSLVKHIIEVVHHGRLFVESEVGKGSTFGFELDLVE